MIALAAITSVADWWAVARTRRSAEYVLKPMALALLVAAVLVAGPADIPEAWPVLLVAVVASLAGDVFLLLDDEGSLFVPGLASFLVAHLGYIGVFRPWDAGLAPVAIAGCVFAALTVTVLARIRAGLVSTDRAKPTGPVAAYGLVITAMVASAWGTLDHPAYDGGSAALIAGGATLFYASDGLIGWTRFVTAYRWAPVTIMVTYHLAQIALVTGALDAL